MSGDRVWNASRRGRFVLLGAVALLAALIATLLAGPAGGPAGATAAAPQPAQVTPPGFAHSTIVDEQWPGFEPDVVQSADSTIYTSDPEGTPSISPLWSSRDNGSSYQLVPGNLFQSDKATCVGGGDTDLYTDPGNELYFSDLQPLDNITISDSPDGGATWNTNCAGAPNTPDDRMWFAGTGSLAQHNLALFNDYDSVITGANPNGGIAGNQLVESVSTDGTHFLPVVNQNASSLAGDCAGAAVQNCVTDNEGISGNQIVDSLHSSNTAANVYIAHTSSTGEVGVRVSEGAVSLGTVPTATWTESPNLAGPLCPGSVPTTDGSSASCQDANGNAQAAAVGENFASIAQDGAGYLYVVFTWAPAKTVTTGSGPTASTSTVQTGPEQIYLVHSLEPAPADPAKTTWSAPVQISGTGIGAGTNVFPWVAAGSDGRVDVAYYHTDETSEGGLYGASNLNKASWDVQMLQSVNARDAAPTYTTTEVSEGPVKYGQICTNGLGCSTGGDRSLGDFLQVKPAADGAALVSYVYDTSAASSPSYSVGPEAIARQDSGPSLYASVGNVTGAPGAPSTPMGTVSDPTGDADYSALGKRTPATDNLDLTGASLANGTTAGGAPALVATIKVKSLASLTTPASEGGPDGSWLMRWDLLTPGQTGNGHIFYVGMDNNQGAGTQAATPTYFAGDVNSETLPPNPLLLAYPQSTPITGPDASYDPATGTITIKVPLSVVGSPAAGTVLHSITALTATSLQPLGPQTEFNQIDATAPFDLVIGAPGTVGTTPAEPSSTATLAGTGTGSGTGTATGTGTTTTATTTTGATTTGTAPTGTTSTGTTSTGTTSTGTTSTGTTTTGTTTTGTTTTTTTPGQGNGPGHHKYKARSRMKSRSKAKAKSNANAKAGAKRKAPARRTGTRTAP